ncbi:MAG: CHAT domain-containing protein [Saprospiraceae bacterium]|jgi:CHAT domain-containing protein
MKNLLTILCLLLTCFCQAQKIDSTIIIINADKTLDTTSVEILEAKFMKAFYKGNYRDAVKYAKPVLPWAKNTLGVEHPQYGMWMDNLGTVLHNAGELDSALFYLEKAIKHGEKYIGKEHEDYITRLNNLGMLYKDLGKFDKGINALEEAVELGEIVFEESAPSYERLIFNLGVIYDFAGDKAKALELYIRSKDITKKHFGTQNKRYAKRIVGIGISEKNRGNYEDAEIYLKESISIYDTLLGPENRFSIRISLGLSQCLFNLGKKEEGLEMVEKAWALAQKKFPLNNIIYVEALTNISALRMDEKIEMQLQQMDSLYTASGDLRNIKNHFRILTKLAEVNDEAGKQKKSLDYYQKIVSLSRDFLKENVENLSQKTQKKLINNFSSFTNPLFSFSHDNSDEEIEGDAAKLAFELNSIQKGLLINNQRVLLTTIAQSNDSLLTRKFGEWKELNDILGEKLSISNNSKTASHTEIIQKLDKLERELAILSPSFQDLQFRSPWQDLQESLEDDEVIIDFNHFQYQLDRRLTDSTLYVAYIIKKNTTTPIEVPLFEEQQIANQKNIRKLYASSIQENLTNLNELIGQQLEPYLTDIKTIHYSPSGLLHKVNFGAIPFNETETISDRFKLHNIGSSRQLIYPHKTPNYQTTESIIYGGIDYQADTTSSILIKQAESEESVASRSLGDNYRALRGNDWDYLEWTKKEVDDIAVTLEKNKATVTLFKGKEATEESFKSIGVNSSSPRILHLATHGYFFPDPKADAKIGFRSSEHPLIRSGLILSGANHAWKGGSVPAGKDDGILTAYEIAQMNLSNTELVVLSACNTGLGDIEGNEGVYGLQRAFKMAGVKYILMSLWSVDDKKTYEFMTRFYELSQTEGKSIPEAYQITQNEMRKKYALPFNPQAWAGFVLVQ